MNAGKFSVVGIADCWVRDADGTMEHHGRFENCFTNNCLGRLLRTLLQVTGGGDDISGTDFPKKMLFCSGACHDTPWDSDIPGIGDIEGSADFTTLADITVGSANCYGTKTAQWTNTTGATVIVSYLAAAYAVAVGKDNLYNMTDITDRDILDTQTFIVNYTWKFNFDNNEEVV